MNGSETNSQKSSGSKNPNKNPKKSGFKEFYKNINLANKLTILRIFLVPFFTATLLINKIPHNLTIALIIFIIASITDFLDGYIARSRNMITEFGKFLDPIADKVIVTSALICFVGLGWIQSWTIVVILSRDLIVSAVRLAAVQSEEKLVIPARMSGKIKTAATMITICVILVLWSLAGYKIISYTVFMDDGMQLNVPSLILAPIGNALMYVCTALTVFSGVQYIWDSKDVLRSVFSEKN